MALALGERIERALHRWRAWRMDRAVGPSGDFHRGGGNAQLWAALPITSGDRVIDAGGFHGEWAAEVLSRYGCSAVIFEPAPEYARMLRARFGGNARVRVEQAGLGGAAGEVDFYMNGTGSSSIRPVAGQAPIRVPIVDVAAVIAAEPGPVACLKLNVEGAEYDILDRLGEANLLDRVGAVVVQFHDFVPDAPARRDRARASLARAHEPVFEYPFVWECWRRKPGA